MKLGKNQAAILRALQQYKSWYRGCSWIWGNNYSTELLLESLVRRGLVVKEPYTYESLVGIHRTTTKYLLVTEEAQR